MEQVRELAYQLWKRDVEANKLERGADEYWADAEYQLTPRTWFLKSGELKLEGEGPLPEVIDVALRHANHHNVALSESMTITDNCSSCNYVVDTIPNLIRLGLLV